MNHRGEIIAKYITENDVNKSKLANKILFGGKKKTARTMYNKLAEPNLSLDDVLSFSVALKHDFSDEIPELKKFNSTNFHTVSEPQENYGKTDDFKEKYYKLLETQNELLRHNNLSFHQLAEALVKLASSGKQSIDDFGSELKEVLLNSSKEINENLLCIARALDKE